MPACCVYRKLHCPRNTVHVNLFMSFILRAVMALLRDMLMADSVGLPDNSAVHYSSDTGAYYSNSTAVHHLLTYSLGGSVAEWLACPTQAQKGLGSNHSRDFSNS